MRRSLHACLMLLLALPIWAGLSAPAAAQDDAAGARVQGATLGERLELYFEAVAANRDFSGIIAARRGDALLAYEVFGEADFEAGTGFDAQSRFHAGSMTKALIYAVLLEVEAEGDLDRSAAVRTLIPELPSTYSATIGEVMAGTAPLPPLGREELIDARNDTFLNWFSHAYEPATAIPAGASAAQLPLMTLIAERAGGGRIELQAALEVFAPLGMTQSVFYRGSGRTPQRLVTGYLPAGSPLQVDRAGARPAGLIDQGWWTTPDDLIRFGAALSRREVDFFRADGSLAGGLQREIISGQAVYQLTGEAEGQHMGILFIPSEELVIAYAVNIASYPAAALPQILSQIILLEPTQSLPERLASYRWLDSHLDAAGQYVLPNGQRLELRAEAGGLVLQPAGELLTPTGEDRLLWRAMNTELLMMRRAEDGAVERLQASRHLPLQSPERFDIGRTDLPELIADEAAD